MTSLRTLALQKFNLSAVLIGTPFLAKSLTHQPKAEPFRMTKPSHSMLLLRAHGWEKQKL